MHRLSRVHRGVQERARCAARRQPDMGELRRDRRVSGHGASLHRHALQSLRRRAVHLDLSDRVAVSGVKWRRGLRRFAVHWLQGLHECVPLRRALHFAGDRHGPQVQLLPASAGGRPRAVVCVGVPDTGDHRGGSRRPCRCDCGADSHRGPSGSLAGAANAAEGALRGHDAGGVGPPRETGLQTTA